MTPWIESLGVSLLTASGFALGRWSSRLPKPYWAVGYLVSLPLVVAISLARRIPRLAFVPPFSWIMIGRVEFALLAVGSAVLLMTPLSRLPHRRQRVMVAALTVAFAGYFILPFVLPGVVRSRLAVLQTKMDRDGVCRQTTGYTCGPAATVTVLRGLGLEAEEGELAILAKATPVSGTQPDSLCSALRRRYGAAGLTCEFRHFRTVHELRDAGPAIVLVKFALLVDHYVAVLATTEDALLIGDPASGARTLSYAELEDIWRGYGVVLTRRPSQS